MLLPCILAAVVPFVFAAPRSAHAGEKACHVARAIFHFGTMTTTHCFQLARVLATTSQISDDEDLLEKRLC